MDENDDGPDRPVTRHIYAAMVAIAKELAAKGIAKDRRNESQGFAFRGIDDFLNVAGPIIAANNVVFLPSYFADFPDTEHVTGKGGTLYKTKLRGVFTFISAIDGSSVTVTAPGEAMDSGDKGLNKAKSAALKYCLAQVFLVPTESTDDADATTPEPTVPAPPAGFREWFPACVAEANKGFEPVRKMWFDAPDPAYRTYAMTYHRDEWEAAKAHGNKVTRAQTAAADATAPAAVAAEKPTKATK